ncbi:hypothetical protein Tco_1252773 [Tanacetum coccineum]
MTIVRVKVDLVKKRRVSEWCRSSCKRFSLRFGIEVCVSEAKGVGFGELGVSGIGVISKVGKIGEDVGGELVGDRGGE